MRFFKDYFISLKAEIYKSRKTLPFWLSTVIPLGVVFLIFLSYYLRDTGMPGNAGMSSWEWFVQSTTSMWGFLMLPLFVTLQTTLINMIEHKADGWKQLFSSGRSRTAIYISKITISLFLLFIAHLIMFFGIMGAGLILNILKPNLEMGSDIPFHFMINELFWLFIGSAIIAPIHHWLSTRFSNVVITFGFGMVITVANFIFMNSDYFKFFPWSYANYFVNQTQQEEVALSFIALLGFLFFVISILAGAVDTSKKEII